MHFEFQVFAVFGLVDEPEVMEMSRLNGAQNMTLGFCTSHSTLILETSRKCVPVDP